MKIKDVAHNHSLTDLLKVGIFSILMLAPMINVGVRSAYVICNKNAYQSYYGNTINETITHETTLSNLTNGNVYELNVNAPFTDLTSERFEINISGDIKWNNSTFNDVAKFTFYIEGGTTPYLFTTTNSNTARDYINLSSQSANIQFTFASSRETVIGTNTIKNKFYYKTYNNYSFLDNVFEYSVNQLEESPLYNWVENTAIYSGVALMNTQLGITQPVISLLVVYWLLLTIIYVIIDIVIRVFTWLTHMIGSKTA